MVGDGGAARTNPGTFRRYARSGVKANRSIPPDTVIPVLTYPDVRAAVAWLGSAFGAVEHVRIGEGHRARGNVWAHCARARAAGATIVDPTHHMYGQRQYSAEDLAGHHWKFTESIADLAPEEYGCTTVAAWRHPSGRDEP